MIGSGSKSSVILKSWILKAMPLCIYCLKEKNELEMSLEHVIPQCLGGAYASSKFTTNRVCKTCNNNLGLFVDASFERSWMISNWLHLSARGFCNPADPVGLPLICVGTTEKRLTGMADDEVCEAYLGPFGEAVFWVRPHDERLFWYSGGNPRTTKTAESRAYFFFSGQSAIAPKIPWLSFADAFRARPVLKVFGTTVADVDPSTIGFCIPDNLDRDRIQELLGLLEAGKPQNNRMSMNIGFDTRFLAKLARGISFCLFGEKILSGDYAHEISKGIWHKLEDPMPAMHGSDIFSNLDNQHFQVLGHKDAIILIIMNTNAGVQIGMHIGKKYWASILCAERAVLDKSDYETIGAGITIALFPFAQKAVHLTLPEYIGHTIRAPKNREIERIEFLVSDNEAKWEQLIALLKGRTIAGETGRP